MLLKRSAALALTVLVAVATVVAQDGASRVAVLRNKLAERLPKGDAPVDGPSTGTTTSTLANTALCILALGRDPARAEGFLRNVLRVQDMDPRSPNFGNVPFRVGMPDAVDENAIEFTMWFLGSALAGYGEKLSARFKEEVVSHQRAAIAAIRRHRVPLDYTNICLMKTANLLMLGKATADESVVAEAQKNFNDWFAFTKRNGIPEYDSPTYSAVQVACLLEIHRQAPDRQMKAHAKAALDFLWTDLAANFFPGTHSLAGPFSRTHDFLFQREAMNYLYFLAGFAPALTAPDDLGGVWLRALTSPYHVPAEIRALAAVPERAIQQRFGAGAGTDRTTYITPDFAVGSASAFHSRQDLKLCVQLTSRKQLPTISVFSGTDENVYGDVDPRRLNKATHLREGIAAVQAKGAVLALLDISPNAADEENATVATNVVIPAHADTLFLDGERVSPNEPFELSASKDSVVGVREGKAAVAIRLFAADGCEGQSPTFSFKYDGNGDKAARLVAYHYRGAPKRLPSESVRVGVLMAAERCDTEEAFAEFMRRVKSWTIEESISGSTWSASIRNAELDLEAALDLQKKLCLRRTVNGVEMPRPLLSVNGRDLAADVTGAK